MAALDNPRQTQLMSKVNEAVEAGEKFVEVFYDTVDKRRQVAAWCSLFGNTDYKGVCDL